MRELTPGIWHWQAPHPDWSPNEPWEQAVSSYAIDDGERLLLFDPLGVPRELEELATERETAVVLTNPWHERDAQSLVEWLGVPVFTPPPDSAEDLMQKYGITAEQAGDGTPDLAWLRSGNADVASWYAPGDRLPFGADVFPGREPNDTVLWLERHRTVVSGDSLVDFGQVWRSPSDGCARPCRASRSPRVCARCSSCRSSASSRPTGRPPTERRSIARSPDGRPRR